MKENAGQMVTRCVLPKQLPIEHVRKPGQGMPVAGMTRAKCPEHILPRQPTLHVGIRSDVVRVVIVDETIQSGDPIYRERDGTQRQAHRQRKR